jgi:hypothetical protein
VTVTGNYTRTLTLDSILVGGTMRTLLVTLLSVAPLSAQQPAADAIPRELALALIDRYGPREGRADIVVGRVPPSFPSNVLPANATVLGGIERSPAAHVVLTYRERPDSVFARLVRHLEREGWDREDEHESRGGFIPPPSERSHRFCRKNLGLMMFVTGHTAGGSLAHLGSWKPPEDYPCGEGRRRNMRGFERVELPPLHAPTGARMLGGGMGGGGAESHEAFIRLETPMHSIDLAAHFAKQLANAGWTISGPTLAEGVVIYGARRRDDEDRMLGGLLYTVDVPGTQQRDAVLRVVREVRQGQR